VEWLLGLDRSAQLGKLPLVSQPENVGPRIEAGQPPLATTPENNYLTLPRNWNVGSIIAYVSPGGRKFRRAEGI
jgi:hypothetical protein